MFGKFQRFKAEKGTVPGVQARLLTGVRRCSPPLVLQGDLVLLLGTAERGEAEGGLPRQSELVKRTEGVGEGRTLVGN